MIKSLKGQLILSILVAIGFIYSSFSYIEFTYAKEFQLPRFFLYMAMIFAVFNTGILTQKYIHSNKKEKNE